MRVKIDEQLYELEYNEFVRWVRAGKIPPDSLVWSQLLTDGEWKRAADMIVFQRLTTETPEAAASLDVPTESLVSAREEAAFSLAQQKPPLLALVLIGLNSVFFLLQMRAGGSTDIEALVTMGAYSRQLVLHSGEYWRILTHTFLHIGFLHFFVNMLILFLLGHMLEGIYGRARFLLVYFFAALGGGLASLLFVKEQIGAGASGAIFGLMGTIVVFGIRYRDRIPQRRRRVFGLRLLPFLLVDLLIGFLYPGINIPAHLGGLIVGVIVAWWLPPRLFDERAQEGEETKAIQVMANAAVLTLLFCGGAMALHIPDGSRNTREHYVPLFVKQAENYESLLAAHPESSTLYENLGRVYLELKELDPDNQEWSDRLIKLYRLAIQHDPDSPAWYNNLAWVYVQDKVRAEEALALAKYAVALGPNMPNQLDTLAWCYLRVGDLSQSLLVFEDVLEVLSMNASKMQGDNADKIAESSLDGLEEVVVSGVAHREFMEFYERLLPQLEKFPRWLSRLNEIQRLSARRSTVSWNSGSEQPEDKDASPLITGPSWFAIPVELSSPPDCPCTPIA